MKRIPTEADLELKEAKEAIQTLREYCESRGKCSNCDREIHEWCNGFSVDSSLPFNWKVGD